MITRQVVRRGLRDPRLLAALRAVPREAFVPPAWRELAYSDAPLPIGEGQTISQPFIVAYMIDALDLRPEDRVLEVGAGSGYAMAVVAELVGPGGGEPERDDGGAATGEVYGIERHATLAAAAAERLCALGYAHAHVRHGDGTLGWPEHAPFEGILVSAGGPEVPPALLEQLAVGGHLVIPVGSAHDLQELLRVTRLREGDDEAAFLMEDLGPVRFVSLIGEAGWAEEEG
jgi:protein-L-isoaspartate(D-aspartate) O-methyltransferase